MTVSTVQLPWTMLVNDTSTAHFIPATGWMPSKNISEWRVKWEIATIGGTGTTSVSPGYQAANFADSPGSGVFIPADESGYKTAADVYYPGSFLDVAADLDDDQIIRFGFMVKSSTGAGYAVVSAAIDLVAL